MLRAYGPLIIRCGIVITFINLLILVWWAYMSWHAGLQGDGTEIPTQPFNFSDFWGNFELGLSVIIPFALLGILLIAIPGFLNRKRSKRAV